jgi:hypothetical protein
MEKHRVIPFDALLRSVLDLFPDLLMEAIASLLGGGSRMLAPLSPCWMEKGTSAPFYRCLLESSFCSQIDHATSPEKYARVRTLSITTHCFTLRTVTCLLTPALQATPVPVAASLPSAARLQHLSIARLLSHASNMCLTVTQTFWHCECTIRRHLICADREYYLISLLPVLFYSIWDALERIFGPKLHHLTFVIQAR